MGKMTDNDFNKFLDIFFSRSKKTKVITQDDITVELSTGEIITVKKAKLIELLKEEEEDMEEGRGTSKYMCSVVFEGFGVKMITDKHNFLKEIKSPGHGYDHCFFEGTIKNILGNSGK
jgi:hypothetical protein